MTHVLWFDNYAKQYVSNVYLVRNPDGMNKALWSAEGLAFIPNDANCPSLGVAFDRQGDKLNAMPAADEWPRYFAVLREKLIEFVDNQTHLLYNNELTEVGKQKIGSVPLTFKRSREWFVEQLGEGEDLSLAGERYANQFNGYNQMDGFSPRNLVPLNAGSNDDSLRWLSRIKARIAGSYRNRYLPLMIDVNIYERFLRVRIIPLDRPLSFVIVLSTELLAVNRSHLLIDECRFSVPSFFCSCCFVAFIR
jgi:hypothetical protein